MAAYVGVTALITLQGQPQGPGVATEILQRPNVDGFMARQIGNRSAQFQMVGIVDVSGYAVVETYDALWRTLRGTLVSITSDIGNIYPNCLLVDHQLVSAKKITRATGGINSNSDHLAMFRFTFQYLAAS